VGGWVSSASSGSSICAPTSSCSLDNLLNTWIYTSKFIHLLTGCGRRRDDVTIWVPAPLRKSISTLRVGQVRRGWTPHTRKAKQNAAYCQQNVPRPPFLPPALDDASRRLAEEPLDDSLNPCERAKHPAAAHSVLPRLRPLWVCDPEACVPESLVLVGCKVVREGAAARAADRIAQARCLALVQRVKLSEIFDRLRAALARSPQVHPLAQLLSGACRKPTLELKAEVSTSLLILMHAANREKRSRDCGLPAAGSTFLLWRVWVAGMVSCVWFGGERSTARVWSECRT
jgi:hypothetical protein